VTTLRKICVFCGSRAGNKAAYRSAAESVGRLLAERGIGVVYGGGNVGLMGAVADAALAAGGEVVGVIPDVLLAKEVGHRGLTKLHVVRNLHERKAMMADLADAFVALPGGFGTFEEFCEVITWSQLSLHQKPCGLLNVLNYWQPMVAMFDHAVDEGFLKKQNRGIVLEDESMERLIEKMELWCPSGEAKWIGRAER
jgi:uncharacterized protein (TIGR00730 family)